jgi:tetratricopeptide (TPR) repeat protein
VPANFELMLETRPLDADAWRLLAEKFATERQIPETLDAIARARHLSSPKNPEVIFSISTVLESIGEDPSTTQAHLSVAKTCFTAGLLDRAVYHVEKALEHDPENIAAHREHAELCWRCGRHEESLDALNRVLWLKRDDIDAAMLLAERLVEMNRHSSAMMIVRRISEKVPPTGEAELRIGRLLRKCGAQEAALWRLEKAVVLISESPHAHFELALAYLETERQAAAIEELIETARIRPDWNEPLRRLSQVYRELGMGDEAIKVEAQLKNRPITFDLEEVVIDEDDDFSDASELSGRLRLMPVAELLQFLAQRKLTGVLRVSSERGLGSIEINRGSVVSAQLDGMIRIAEMTEDQHFEYCQSVIGEMIGWTDGQIDFVSAGSHTEEPKYSYDVSHLLLETMRKLDEASAI